MSQQHFLDILRHFDAAMLVTHARDGVMHARPMAVAATEDDGSLWFITSMSTQKIGELEMDPRATVTMQGDRRYMSMVGSASIDRDRGKVDQLWDKGFDVWFEHGKDDPSIVLIHFVPEEAEYWDNSGARGLRYLFEAARALVTGGTVETSNLETDQIKLH